MTQDRAVGEGESRFQWEKELSLRSAQSQGTRKPTGNSQKTSLDPAGQMRIWKSWTWLKGDLEPQEDPGHNHPDLQWSHLGPMNSSKQNKKTSGRGEGRLQKPWSLSEVIGHEVQTSHLIGQLYW